MKLHSSLLLERARCLTTISVSAAMEVIVVDDVVDATNGEPTTITADRLRGLDVREAASYLHDNYAGDAVFLIRTPTAFAVIRPPFSELPVFYRQHEDSIEVWSGLETPKSLLERPPDFDLNYLAGRLLNRAWTTPATGLLGVQELLSGAVLIFEGGKLWQRDLLAAAVKKLRPQTAISYADQVVAIKKLIMNSVRHKIGPHLDCVSIFCSGGVDSSVLAVAAATLYPMRKFPLIHCFSEDHLHGDERFYFDAVAGRVGWPNAKVDMNAGASRTSLSPALLAPSVRPLKAAATLPTVAAMYNVAKANKSKVVLTGDGGDQLFLLNSPILYSREIVREACTPSPALRGMAELAIMERCTIWSIAGEVLHGRRTKRFQENFFGNQAFPKNPFALRGATTKMELAPNAAQLANIGVSRAFQYFGMRNAELNRITLNNFAIEERKAFVFWPLIRAAISAKRSYHLNGGRDRALERDAFKNELPFEIYQRVSKGGSRDLTERYEFEGLIETLLKSPMVKHGLVGDHIKNISIKNINHDTAFALVVARGMADWMELYE